MQELSKEQVENLLDQYPMLRTALDKRVSERAQARIKVGKEFTVETYTLTTEAKYDTQNFEANKFRQPFKSMWVYSVSDSGVQASIKFNFENDTGSGIPLKKNLVLGNTDSYYASAALEYAAQSGKTIVIVYCHNTLISPGFVDVSLTGTVLNRNGNTLSAPVNPANDLDSLMEVEIFPSLSTRGVGFLCNYSDEIILIGPAGACKRKVFPQTEFEWRNPSALYMISDDTTIDKADIVKWEEEFV